MSEPVNPVSLVGKTFAEVKALCPVIRISSINGERFVGTRDHRVERLNVHLQVEDYDFEAEPNEGVLNQGVVLSAHFG